MSAPKWLWDQPQSWHIVNRDLIDIGVLLNYLNEQPDSRLMAYFEPTQDRGPDETGRRSTRPPCDRYEDFLVRLNEIAAAFQTGRQPAETAAPDGRKPLDPVAFVEWSRDFLAAVAAPATAASIRLTREYAMHQCRRPWRSAVPKQVSDPGTESRPQAQPDPEEAVAYRAARRLAGSVRMFERATVMMVVLTVCISIYALSGRLILSNERQTAAAWEKLDALIEAQEDKVFAPATFPVTVRPDYPVRPLCDLVEEPARTQLASNGETPPLRHDGNRFLTARQAHLCDQRGKLLQDLFTVSTHLQFWSSVIARQVTWRPFGWNVPFWPAALFGVEQGALERYASEGKGQLCAPFVSPEAKAGLNPVECGQVLWNLIHRSRNVAESILGSVTQYVLPVCYGFLGAMAAALRLIRRKVDAATLVPTDRARLQQGAILGVLCGAVIGLFANQFAGSDGGGALGLSALALIAGYNVDGVFRFLDELSDRVFGGAGAKAK